MTYQSSDVCGVYSIQGWNPGADDLSYEGELELQEDGELIVARWVIGPDIMFGSGFFEGDKLVLAFNFIDPYQGAVTGVVMYDVRASGQLEGRWSVFGGQLRGRESCTLLQKTGPLH